MNNGLKRELIYKLLQADKAIKQVNEDKEEKDFSELFDDYCEQEKLWRTEGSQGYRNLLKVTDAIGYRHLTEFFEDNPGAIEAIFNFIRDARNVTEWEEKIKALLHDEEE